MAVIAVILGLAAFLGLRSIISATTEYTSTEQVELPVVELPDRVFNAVQKRVDTFSEALQQGGDDPVAIVLTADEINGLITANRPKVEGQPDLNQLKGKVHISMPGDKVIAKISFPLDTLEIPAFKGRYLNGEAVLQLSAQDGLPVIDVEELEANGKTPPDFVLNVLNRFGAEWRKAIMEDPTAMEGAARIEQLEVKDGRLYIKAIPGTPVAADVEEGGEAVSTE
jgi:hypothetical protein